MFTEKIHPLESDCVRNARYTAVTLSSLTAEHTNSSVVGVGIFKTSGI
jgi:hypothetical protein